MILQLWGRCIMIIQLALWAIVVRFGGEAIFALCYEVTYIHDACESGDGNVLSHSQNNLVVMRSVYYIEHIQK